ncbi:MAG: hypothetical protein AAGI71_07880 [Bacteroidota bacterium]
MDIYRTTAVVSGLLIVAGLVAYTVSGASSMTALIPSFLGLAVGALWAIARAKESMAKHAMHGVAVLALIGGLGSVGPVISAITSGEIARPIAFGAQLVTGTLCIWLIVAAVQHFRAVRRGA